MNDLINKPNIEKNQGDRLSYSEINALDNAIDSCIDKINLDMLNYCNVNLEISVNPDEKYSLPEVINLIKPNRRVPGITIKFLDKNTSNWVEYRFLGEVYSPEIWSELNNWKEINSNIIDGGTF